MAVFPTHVGVFLYSPIERIAAERLPHARGGVSAALWCASVVLMSSPRTWGCFCRGRLMICCCIVFPTHVGVFLCPKRTPTLIFGLPHARGGVSIFLPLLRLVCLSSPRTWGCFCLVGLQQPGSVVFPTHVGVFPSFFLFSAD